MRKPFSSSILILLIVILFSACATSKKKKKKCNTCPDFGIAPTEIPVKLSF